MTPANLAELPRPDALQGKKKTTVAIHTAVRNYAADVKPRGMKTWVFIDNILRLGLEVYLENERQKAANATNSG